MAKLNYAVYLLESKFRLTAYQTRYMAGLACENILRDQPNLKGKIAVKQKEFENAEDR